MHVQLPIVVLLIVFTLIALRGVGRFRIAIWQAMVGGALVVLVSGDIAPRAALAAIDWDVMLFLFGMFVVGQALVASGELYRLAYELFSRVRSVDGLVLALLFAVGGASAVLMNDTLAIVGTPLVLRLAREHGIDTRLLLLALAFAVTTGSVMSPIGNPQNLLIAIHSGLPNPFVEFFARLALPTVLALLLSYAVLRLFFRREFHATPLVHTPVTVHDMALARLARASVLLIVTLIVARSASIGSIGADQFRLSYIALAGALPLLLISPRRGELLRRLDWTTLAFFAGMFVLMAAVWNTGGMQAWLTGANLDVGAPAAVFAVGTGLSQLVSNVPLVALYLPLLDHAGAGMDSYFALAAASTLAGNMLILGAASNVIIVQSAERHGASLGFVAFARVGIPLTLLQVGLYWLML